jgi:hypothetical protein
MGAVALAVGLGVQLGESTVHEINPIHFQGIPAHPRDRGAALDPLAIQPAAPSGYAQAYGWGEGNAARAAASGQEDFDFAPPPIVRSAAAVAPAWQDEAPVVLQPWPPGRVSAHPEVERYTDFPIVRKPVAETAPGEDQALDEDRAPDEDDEGATGGE